ncbi:MAG: LicD family protein [Lachnospiraceae bacterium]|nr:LicD family protein [Lachnospiraceae bacterium]
MGQPVLVLWGKYYFLEDDMDYPHKYFEDEVREGFYVMGQMKRVWAAQIEVMHEVDKICRRHNIKWFADCGTLLGAVRHKGYIPWDDDMDICMLRDEYNKFIEIAKDELPEGYSILKLDVKGDPYYQYITRVTNGRRFEFDKDFLDRYHECQYPTGVDLFPLEYLSPNQEYEAERKVIAREVFAYADTVTEENEDDPDYKDMISEVEQLCNIKIDEEMPTKQRMFIAAETLFKLYGSQGAEHVALMPYWLKDSSHKYPIESFRESIMLPFEHTEIPVPIEYDRVLRFEYGDYMKPVNAGGMHDYPFFEALENMLIDRIDKYYFRYKFKPDDLENSERKSGDYTKKQVVNYIQMTKEAHDAIILIVAQGDTNTACNLLAACQESTINIGELIEKTYGEGFSAVSILEEYCESVYQLHQALLSGEFGSKDAEGIASFLGDIYARMQEVLETDIINRKEMVFIPYRSDYWSCMEGLWKKAKEEGIYDVYVVPIPYYKKTARSELSDMYYDIDEYPDYVELVDYKSYDFMRRHPDIIVTHCPFDQCNYTISLSAEHYSKNLKKFTEKLIYVSPYVINEIGLDKTGKAWKTLDFFCAVPGVVHSDEILVQSAQMRETYIERLTDMSGEDYRSVWEDRVKVLSDKIGEACISEEVKEKSVDEKSVKLANLSDEWRKIIYKPDGTYKKIVLYNVGIAYMAQYGEKVIDKIINSLEVFKNAKDDIALIWYANPHLMRVLKRVDLKLRDKYNKVVEKYKSEGWGIYDESRYYNDLIDISDAFYGDPGNIPHMFRQKKKPAMIEAIDILN